MSAAFLRQARTAMAAGAVAEAALRLQTMMAIEGPRPDECTAMWLVRRQQAERAAAAAVAHHQGLLRRWRTQVPEQPEPGGPDTAAPPA